MMKKGLRKKISKILAAVMVVSVFCIGDWGELSTKAATACDAVNIAAGQVGYHEKASNSNLDDFTANSGSGNYTKYARDLGVANGYPWCAYFTWWCMQTAGVDSGSYPRSGYVPTIYNWFQSRGLFRARGTYTPHKGDYIIFGSQSHVGFVESVSGKTVYTIEGNSSDKVARNQYSLDSNYILGYGLMNSAGDYTAPVIKDVKVTSRTTSNYTISCTVTDDSGISFVTFPTWTAKNDQDDIDKSWLSSNGYSFGKVSGNTATFTVDLSKHNFEEGEYITHIYAQDVYGNLSGAVGISVNVDLTAPEISDVQVSNIDENGYDVTFKIKDDNSGIQFVACPTYTAAAGISELPSNWNTMSKYYSTISNGVGTYHVDISDHNNAAGEYHTELRAYDNFCNYTRYDITGIIVPEPYDNSIVKTDMEEVTEEVTTEETTEEAAVEVTDEVTEAPAEEITDGSAGETPAEEVAEVTEAPAEEVTETPAAQISSDITVTRDDSGESSDDIQAAEIKAETIEITSADMLDDISVIDIDVDDGSSFEATVQDSTVEINNTTNITNDNSTVNNITNNTTNNNITNDNSTVNNTTVNNTTNNVTNQNKNSVSVYNTYSGSSQGTSYSNTAAQLENLKNVYQNYLDTYPDMENSEQLRDTLSDMVEELVNIYMSEYLPDNFEVTDEGDAGEAADIEELDDTETNDTVNSSMMEYYTIVNGDLIKVSIAFK